MSERARERKSAAERAVQSKRMSERCEQTSKRTSEWPSTYIPILGCSKPPCTAEAREDGATTIEVATDSASTTETGTYDGATI